MRTAGNVIEGHNLLLQSKKKWGTGKWEVRTLLLTSCFLLLTFVLSSGCATTQDVNRVQYQINELSSEVVKVKQKYEAISTERVQTIEEEQKATSKALSDLVIKAQGLASDIQVLTGRLDEAKYFSEKNLKELIESKNSLIAQMKETETAVKDLKGKLTLIESEFSREIQRLREEIKKAEESKIEKQEEEAKKEEQPAKKDASDIYIEAYEDYKSGKTQEAREKFKSILKDYPENEYTDNARFWIGETYYKDKDYENAILAYDELLRKNPDSNKTPDALLKQGLAFYAIKESDLGKITLEKLIKRFPNSEQAKIAKKRLEETTTQKKVSP